MTKKIRFFGGCVQFWSRDLIGHLKKYGERESKARLSVSLIYTERHSQPLCKIPSAVNLAGGSLRLRRPPLIPLRGWVGCKKGNQGKGAEMLPVPHVRRLNTEDGGGAWGWQSWNNSLGKATLGMESLPRGEEEPGEASSAITRTDPLLHPLS